MCQDSVDHCRVKMNFHNGQYTSGDVKWDVNGDHCDMSQDTQCLLQRTWWCHGMTITPITVNCKLLVVQCGCRVVYFGEWDAHGDPCDMC